MNNYYVYYYSSKKDGLFWIGKGKNKRINQNHRECPLCYNILEARKKENIDIKKEKIFENLSEIEAFNWERNLIWFFEPRGNLTNGGEGISGYKWTSEIRKKNSLSTKEFIRRCKMIHNNFYDYSEVNYYNAHKKVVIICPKHGVFKQRPDHHLEGFGCKKCMGDKRRINYNGEKNHNSILNVAQVQEIRKKYIPYKYPLRKIAKEYNVSNSCIQAIIENKTWKEEQK